MDQEIRIAKQAAAKLLNNDFETQRHGKDYLPEDAFKALMTLSVMSCFGLKYTESWA